jgi:hypothetical protein
MGISFRLDARLEAQVRRHAADTRTTISAVVRDASGATVTIAALSIDADFDVCRDRSNKPLVNLLR